MTIDDKLDEILDRFKAFVLAANDISGITDEEAKTALRQLIREAREEALRDGFEAAKRLKDYADVVEEARLAQQDRRGRAMSNLKDEMVDILKELMFDTVELDGGTLTISPKTKAVRVKAADRILSAIERRLQEDKDNG